MYCHPFPSISLFFLSFLSFFSFHLFIFSHIPFFIFSFSLPLSPPFPLQNFKEKWAGIENIRGPSFSSVIHIYVYSHIAYCTTLPVIWKEILRRVWGGEGRKNVDLQKKTVEIFEIHCYVGITREGGGGGRERGNLSRTSEIRWRRSTTAFFSPVFLPLFLLFLLFLSFFFLSLFPRKITGPECRTNENGLFVIISSRDARISLHFPSVLVIFRILSLYIYKFFLSLSLS